jgi:chemotaxis regulatin CheY-phosphate phosphatase CheZ
MSRRTDELLYDSQATLRLLDHELSELRAPGAVPAAYPAPAAVAAVAAVAAIAPAAPSCQCGTAPSSLAATASLPALLERASGEITAVLTSLRQSRDALTQTSVERLAQTNEKLREVTSATEVAATDILDSLDRAGQIVDALDAEDGAPAEGGEERRGPALRGQLRDEIFGMMAALQFQDITTQQLNYASSVLVDVEARLTQLAHLFESGSTSATATAAAALGRAPEIDAATFDPNATTRHAETRQALADEIFTGR